MVSLCRKSERVDKVHSVLCDWGEVKKVDKMMGQYLAY